MAIKRNLIEFIENQKASKVLISNNFDLETIQFLPLNSPVRQHYIDTAKNNKTQAMYWYINDYIFTMQIIGFTKIEFPDFCDDPLRTGVNAIVAGCSGCGKTQAMALASKRIHPIFVNKATSFLDTHGIQWNKERLSFYIMGNRKKKVFQEIAKRDGFGVLTYNEGAAGLSDLKQGALKDGVAVLIALGDPSIDPMLFSTEDLNLNPIENNHGAFLGNFVLSGYLELLRDAETGTLGRMFAPWLTEIRYSMYERMYNDAETPLELLAEMKFQIWRFFNFEYIDARWQPRQQPIIFKCLPSEINKFECEYKHLHGNLNGIDYKPHMLNGDGTVNENLRTGQDAYTRIDEYFETLLSKTNHEVKKAILRRIPRLVLNFAVYNKIAARALELTNVNDQINFENINILDYEDIYGPAFDMCKRYYNRCNQMIGALHEHYGTKTLEADNTLNIHEVRMKKLLLFNKYVNQDSHSFSTSQFMKKTSRVGKVDDVLKAMQELEKRGLFTLQSELKHGKLLHSAVKIPSSEWHRINRQSNYDLLKRFKINVDHYNTTCKYYKYKQENLIEQYKNALINQLREENSI